ncbi:hypothetical protein V8F06_014548, partial [Rhypophila decipiens]
AQSRRKAQNRKAQRAFRERKERHIKDLETRLMETASENERLKRDLQKMSTENEILRATSVPGSNGSPMVTGPVSYNPTTFYADVLQNHPTRHPSRDLVS